jgi:hypothetical protein
LVDGIGNLARVRPIESVPANRDLVSKAVHITYVGATNRS